MMKLLVVASPTSSATWQMFFCTIRRWPNRCEQTQRDAWDKRRYVVFRASVVQLVGWSKQWVLEKWRDVEWHRRVTMGTWFGKICEWFGIVAYMRHGGVIIIPVFLERAVSRSWSIFPWSLAKGYCITRCRTLGSGRVPKEWYTGKSAPGAS